MKGTIPKGRSRVVLDLGNLLELAGVVLACFAVAQLAGAAWALLAGGVALIVGAELVYDGHLLRIPLPHRPRPLFRLQRLAFLASQARRRFVLGVRLLIAYRRRRTPA